MPEGPTSRWAQLSSRLSGADYDRAMLAKAATGMDMHGEASFVDARLDGPSDVLDAGCGTGRVAFRLAELGHRVDGVDLDESMIEVARRKSDQIRWYVGDLATLDLDREYDLIVCAGNVVPLLAPDTLAATLGALRSHLRPGGLLVCGYGLDAAHLPAGCEPTPLDEVDTASRWAGLELVQRFGTWESAAFDPAAGYVVTVHSAGASTRVAPTR